MTLRHLNLLDFFSYRFYSYDVGMRKPNPEMFRHALRLSETRENDSLMVGDRFEMDVLPALEIGMQGLWYVRKEVKDIKSKAKWAISDLREILSRIEE
jgi:putative hydrolase of the HAD superfamily